MKKYESTPLHRLVNSLTGQLLRGIEAPRHQSLRSGTATATVLFITALLVNYLLTQFWFWLPLPDWLPSAGLVVSMTLFYGFTMWYVWYMVRDYAQHTLGWDARSSAFCGLVICLAITLVVVMAIHDDQQIDPEGARFGTILLLAATLVGAFWPAWSVVKRSR